MAILQGTGGSIVTTTTDIFTALSVTSWSMDMNQEILDVTPFNATNWRTKWGGLSSGSGTCSGFLDDTTPFVISTTFETPQTQFTFNLTAGASGIVLAFTGLITNFNHSAEVGSMASFSCSFEASGAVTAT